MTMMCKSLIFRESFRLIIVSAKLITKAKLQIVINLFVNFIHYFGGDIYGHDNDTDTKPYAYSTCMFTFIKVTPIRVDDMTCDCFILTAILVAMAMIRTKDSTCMSSLVNVTPISNHVSTRAGDTRPCMKKDAHTSNRVSAQ